MKLVNFILWLIVGALIGWFASRVARLEERPAQNQIPVMVTPNSSDGRSL